MEKTYFYFFQISGRFLPYLASCCLEADMALVARVLCFPDPQVHLENLFFLYFVCRIFYFRNMNYSN